MELRLARPSDVPPQILMPKSTLQASTTNALTEWRVPLIGLTGLLWVFLLLWPDNENASGTSTALTGDGNNERDRLFTSLKPTSTAIQVTWRVFSAAGALNYEISAQGLEQFQLLELMKVERPVIRMTTDQQRPWVIQAAQGEISNIQDPSVNDAPKADKLDLRGDVQITQDQTDPRHALRLFTPQLSIFPSQQRALTNEPVVVRHTQFITTSHGLDLNLKTGTLSFAKSDNTRVVSKLFLNQQSKGT